MITSFLSIFLVSLTTSSTVSFGTYSNSIPSYTYPFTLNAGDTISQNLSWSNSQDLDIYLYKQGQDLLSRSTYIDR